MPQNHNTHQTPTVDRPKPDEECRTAFFDAADAAYNQLKADKRLWQEELLERKSWEATLSDGLDEEQR